MIYIDRTTSNRFYTEEQILKLMKIFRDHPIDHLGMYETSSIIKNLMEWLIENPDIDYAFRETI